MANKDDQSSVHSETTGDVTPRRMLTKRPSTSSLVKDALKPNLSAVEATSQLKVLCRKFAALTEKVKEETRTREEAEKEVRRLKAIVEGNKSPVGASYRAETQSYIRELKEAQEALKQELRDEKEKNAKLVSKALELENEKRELLVAAISQPKTQEPSCSDQTYPSKRGEWGREQTIKIQETLQTTIDELQDELTRKEEELDSYRERLQRERTRVKTLEVELQEREETSREEHNVLKELESSIQEQRGQFEAIEKEMQATEQRLEEETTLRNALEQQIETLNDVNVALEQRAKALVRRLELSQSLVGEMEELKLQVRDVEVDKETLVRSIKEVKDQHFLQETQWKAQLEQQRSEKLVLAAQISDLQTEIISLRAQNSLFSQWMLVRNENMAVAQQQQQSQQDPCENEDGGMDSEHRSFRDRFARQPRRPSHDVDHFPNSSRARVRPLATSDLDDNTYTQTTARCPLSPSKTRSMTTVSQIKQASNWMEVSRCTSVSSSTSSTDECEKWGQREKTQTNFRPSTTVRSTDRSTLLTRTSSANCRTTSKLSDHERLRELMSRNRELQSRLQQETVATRNLEQEISQISSQRGQTNSFMQST